uniref:Uncharacterized protein n=1 Tax=Amphiprion percula TaxID=161767 RepID=A0A3P8TGQ5_AMPPE
MCVFRQWLWVKAFSQMVHLYGLSPLCVLMWTVKYVLRAHAFPQIPHTNGLTPEWIATWLSRLVLRLKDQPQTGQRGPLVVKPRPHSPQWAGPNSSLWAPDIRALLMTKIRIFGPLRNSRRGGGGGVNGRTDGRRNDSNILFGPFLAVS